MRGSFWLLMLAVGVLGVVAGYLAADRAMHEVFDDAEW